MFGPIAIHQIISCLNPYDYEEVDVGASAIGLTSSKVSSCHAASIRFTGDGVNFRVDGQADPTASVGIPVYDGDTQVFSRLEANQLKMIRIGSTNGKARVTYYK